MKLLRSTDDTMDRGSRLRKRIFKDGTNALSQSSFPKSTVSLNPMTRALLDCERYALKSTRYARKAPWVASVGWSASWSKSAPDQCERSHSRKYRECIEKGSLMHSMRGWD